MEKSIEINGGQRIAENLLNLNEEEQQKTLIENRRDYFFLPFNSRFINFSLSDVTQAADSICLFEGFEMIVICLRLVLSVRWERGYPAINVGAPLSFLGDILSF